MDLFLIWVIATSYSGILAFTPTGTFDHAWIERGVDCIMLVFIVAQPKTPLLARPVVLFAAWLALYTVIGYAVSDRPDVATTPAVHNFLVNIPLLLFVGIGLHNRTQWGRLASALQVVAIGAGVVCIAQQWLPEVALATGAIDLHESFAGVGSVRSTALWNNANQAAFCFLFTFVVSLWCRNRLLAWGGRVAAIVGVFLTLSRSGLLFMAVFAAAYVAAHPILLKRAGRSFRAIVATYLAAAIGLGVVIMAVIWLMSTPGVEIVTTVSEQAVTRFQMGQLDAAKDTRTGLAFSWLNKAADGPWYGQGLGSFQGSEVSGVLGPHNQFILIYGEVGILGLLTYLIVLVVGMSRIWSVSVARKDRFVLAMTWVLFLACHLKAHVMLDAREFMVIWGLLFMAPYALRTAPRPLPVEHTGRTSRHVTQVP